VPPRGVRFTNRKGACASLERGAEKMPQTAFFSDVPIARSVVPPLGAEQELPPPEPVGESVYQPADPPDIRYEREAAPLGPEFAAITSLPPLEQAEAAPLQPDPPQAPTPDPEPRPMVAAPRTAPDAPAVGHTGRLSWLPAASIFIGLFIVAGIWALHRPSEAGAGRADVPYSDSGGFDLTVPRWPAAFNASALPSAPARLASMLHSKTIDDMVYAYEYYVGQQYRISTLASDYPDLRPALSAAQRRFDQRFRPSIEAMQRLLADWNPDRWQEIRRGTDAWAHRAGGVHLPPDRARAYLDTVAARAMGKLSPRVLDTLLAFNPDYVANPAREFQDGCVREFMTTERLSARGMKIRLKYPRSWTAEGTNESAIAQRFRDRRSQFTLMSLKVANLADPAIESASDMTDLLSLGDIRGMYPDAHLTDAGVMSLVGGRDVLWREICLTRQAADGMQKLRVVDFTLVCAGRCVSITFSVAAPAAATDAQLDAAYARNAPLFKLITASIDVSR